VVVTFLLIMKSFIEIKQVHPFFPQK